ncbi:MAG: hypothetical protein KDA81_21185 [Planctomycetaceae bacterium]|nr:hypothetical protein [Planctomycetaceae bacterium]
MLQSSLRRHLSRVPNHTALPDRQNKALDAEPPIALFVNSPLTGGSLVNAVVLPLELS